MPCTSPTASRQLQCSCLEAGSLFVIVALAMNLGEVGQGAAHALLVAQFLVAGTALFEQLLRLDVTTLLAFDKSEVVERHGHTTVVAAPTAGFEEPRP